MIYRGAGADALGRQLVRLLRIVELRIDAKGREVDRVRAAEAARRQELEAQAVRLESAEAKLLACRESIAEVRRRAFSPFDATGHRAAEERVGKLRDKEALATRACRDRLRAAESVRERAETEWRRLRARRDALGRMHSAARKGAALHREMLEDLVQDEDFAARGGRGR